LKIREGKLVKIVKRAPHCLVIDDFLSKDEFRAVQVQLMFEKYEKIHQRQWRKAWRLTDGEPLIGPTYSYSAEADSGERKPSSGLAIEYPAQRPTDFFVESLNQIVFEAAEVVGEKNKDWRSYGFHPYLYPVGTGLGWHEDDSSVSGAFVYYGHPDWRMDWGGELLILDQIIPSQIELPDGRVTLPERMKNMPLDGVTGPDFGWHSRSLHFMERGLGDFIAAKPNRLIFIGPHHSHSVRPVSPCAGENIRTSLAGFFQK
jgi:hypothetical protein